VGVSDGPEIIDRESNGGSGRGNGGGSKRKRSGKRRNGANAVEVEVPVDASPAKDRRVSRERSLNRLLAGLRAVNAGDFSVQLTANGDPLMADIIEVFNSVVSKQGRLTDELARVSTSVGARGKMRERAALGSVGGRVEHQHRRGEQPHHRSRAAYVGSLTRDQSGRRGDLSQKVELEIEGKQVQGEFFRIGSTVNRMVDQLNAFASEVTRVAREVGTEGCAGRTGERAGVAARGRISPTR
jgi:methyl-accepting chemotaxis protein